MGNCWTAESVDTRSARSSYFDAKKRENEAIYTCSEFREQNKLCFSVKASGFSTKKKPVTLTSTGT